MMDGGKHMSDSLPVYWPGAQALSASMKIGSKVQSEGRGEEEHFQGQERTCCFIDWPIILSSSLKNGNSSMRFTIFLFLNHLGFGAWLAFVKEEENTYVGLANDQGAWRPYEQPYPEASRETKNCYCVNRLFRCSGDRSSKFSSWCHHLEAGSSII